MFGQEPGAERRQGVMNQHVVTKLEARFVTYYILHTRGESPTSILITSLTKRFKESQPQTSNDIINDRVMNLVTEISNEKLYRDVKDYDSIKETMLVPPGGSTEVSLEHAVSKATSSCVLGIVKKADDDVG